MQTTKGSMVNMAVSRKRRRVWHLPCNVIMITSSAVPLEKEPYILVHAHGTRIKTLKLVYNVKYSQHFSIGARQIDDLSMFTYWHVKKAFWLASVPPPPHCNISWWRPWWRSFKKGVIMHRILELYYHKHTLPGGMIAVTVTCNRFLISN